MGRATEFFDYINRDYEPTPEGKELYCSLTITKELKQLRRAKTTARKKERKQNDHK